MGDFLLGARRRWSHQPRALLGLVAAAAAWAALPATALADFTPSLSLDQTAGTTAGSSPAIGFDEKFASSTGDTVKSVTLALPPGLLPNESIAGGACLRSSTPIPACQVGSGTITLVGGGSQSITADIVKPPNPADVAGLAVVTDTGGQLTGDVTLGAAGATVTFANLAFITETNVSLTGLRMPSSCPSPAADVTMTAVSQAGTSATATAPLTVTGCSGLPYAPTLAVSEAKDATDDGATLGLETTQAANEAASKAIVLKLPSDLGVNLAADGRCLTRAGRGCVVGTATATSPLAPMKLTGTVTLGRSEMGPAITVSFPAPFAITLLGDVNLTTGTVTINHVPDVPLTDLKLTITGANGHKAFTTSCTPSRTTGTFTSQSGVTKIVSAKATLTNCAGGPTASGAASGLPTGHPKLRIKVSRGQGAARIASVAVALPAGLKFARSRITTTPIKGLAVSGASVKSVALKGGKLVLTFKKGARSLTVKVNGPILTETGSLQRGVKERKVNSVTLTLEVTDAKHTTTSVPLKLKAH
jgi:hypothetical protein